MRDLLENYLPVKQELLEFLSVASKQENFTSPHDGLGYVRLGDEHCC